MTHHKHEPPSPADKALFDAETLAQQGHARRLGAALHYPGGPDDLLHDFYTDRLEVFASRLAALPASSRAPVFRVALRNYAIDRIRREARHTRALEAWRESLAPRNSLPPALPDTPRLDLALSTLPSLEREIVERSFGIHGVEDSERALGRALQMDRGEVHRRLIDGLVRLTLHLGKHALLTPRQVAVCRLVLEGGCSVAEAAERLGITTQDARTALAEAREEMENVP